jgi:hypothetical protein
MASARRDAATYEQALRELIDLFEDGIGKVRALSAERAALRLVSLRAVEPEVLLTVEQAAKVIEAHPNTVRRIAKRHPRIVRRNGRLVRYERTALLQAFSKGV